MRAGGGGGLLSDVLLCMTSLSLCGSEVLAVMPVGAWTVRAERGEGSGRRGLGEGKGRGLDTP